MRKFVTLLAVSALTLGACSGETKTADNNTSATAPAKDARLAAVLIYADWCGSCKVLDPKVKSIKAGNNFKMTKFVTLDYTDKNADNFYASADAIGVSQAVKAHLAGTIKTGQMLLIDLDDKTVVGVIKKDMSESDMVKTIRSAASNA